MCQSAFIFDRGREAVNDVVGRFKWVGTRPIRPDGVPKVTGRAMYAADLAMPGQLVGKILRSPHAHARIRSIDTSKAAALPGVKAVVVATDFPEQKLDRKSTRLNSSHQIISYAVFCL